MSLGMKSSLKSDKLIPHTRRAALTALRDAAAPHGLEDSLSFTFTSASGTTAAQSQPTSGDYRVSVESIVLKIAAPLDGAVFRMLDDVNRTFPGSVVLESMTLSREPSVNETQLAAISAGAIFARFWGSNFILADRAEGREPHC